jgi:hypothetical protein
LWFDPLPAQVMLLKNLELGSSQSLVNGSRGVITRIMTRDEYLAQVRGGTVAGCESSCKLLPALATVYGTQLACLVCSMWLSVWPLPSDWMSS